MKNHIKAPKNYILIPEELENDPRLNDLDRRIYGYLRRMMNLSIGNDYFYDKYEHYYFVIYSRKKLSAKVGKHERTIGRSLNRLENCDYIIRIKKGRVRGIKIRLPKAEPYFIKDGLKPISNPKSTKMSSSNKTELTSSNKTKMSDSCSNNIRNNKSRSVHLNTKKNMQAVFRWRSKVQAKVCLPKGALDRIIAFVEYKYNHFDKAKADKMVDIINKSRNSIIKSYRKDGITIPREKSRFENEKVQKMLGGNLGLYLGQIMYNTDHNNKTPNANNYFGYLVHELQLDFEHWFGLLKLDLKETKE